MARRTSGLEQLISLPWWLNLVLGAIAFVVLRYIIPNIEFQSPLVAGVAKAAPGFSFAALVIFSVAPALSFFLQHKKNKLVDSQTSIDTIRQLSWKEFELLLSEAFRRQGYAIQENLKGGPDGGVDLVLSKDGLRTLVQCKHWKHSKVGVSVIRELYGVVTAAGADRGIVVCSGDYTQEAQDFARQTGIQLVGENDLLKMLSGVQAQPQIETLDTPLACPLCGSTMVERVAKRGKSAGRKFWGCSRYPHCKGTL